MDETKIIKTPGLQALHGSYEVMCRLREFAQTMKDEGTHIDSGSGFGEADMQVTVAGIEYNIQISIQEPITDEERAEFDKEDAEFGIQT